MTAVLVSGAATDVVGDPAVDALGLHCVPATAGGYVEAVARVGAFAASSPGADWGAGDSLPPRPRGRG